MASVAIEQLLSTLFQQWSGEIPTHILPLAPSGSDRIYYRLQSKTKVAVGAYNPHEQENEAFVSFAKHFREKGLPVPEIYAQDLDQCIYLQEDLGATTLYSYLLQKGDGFPDDLMKMYKRVVEQLAHLQVTGGEGLDYSKCFPCESFDKQSMLWDFNYFQILFSQISQCFF